MSLMKGQMTLKDKKHVSESSLEKQILPSPKPSLQIKENRRQEVSSTYVYCYRPYSAIYTQTLSQNLLLPKFWVAGPEVCPLNRQSGHCFPSH